MNKSVLIPLALSALLIPHTVWAKRKHRAKAPQAVYASTYDGPTIYDPYAIVATNIRNRLEQTDAKLQELVASANDTGKFIAAYKEKGGGVYERRLAAFFRDAERAFSWFEASGAPSCDPRLLGFGGRSPEETALFVDAATTFVKVAGEGAGASRLNDIARINAKITELADALAQGKKIWLAEIKNPIKTKADGPIILAPAQLIGPYHKNGMPQKVYYQGQPALNGMIDLVPSSAFFKSFKGEGYLPAFPNDHFARSAFQYLTKSPLDEQELAQRQAAKKSEIEEIKALFLARGSSQRDVDDLDEPNGAALPIARWHLYCPLPGGIKAAIYLKVSAEQALEPWIVEMAEGDQIEDKPMTRLETESQTLHLRESDGETPQPEELTFHVKHAGRVSFYLSQYKMPKASGSLAFIRLQGPAIRDASLLRVRYRPSALHMKFHAPEECPDPLMWVVESKPVGGCHAFSPITTPFGYFGHRFIDVYAHQGASLHFSMWGAARTEADGTVNMAYAPRIIASNNPKARGQISSNEGTTVRGSSPFYTAPARSVIQAMRVTKETDGAHTFYGYLYDEQRQSWRLYTAGQSGAHHGHLFRGGGDKQVHLGLGGAGSFVEVPGPFGVEMSGDVERKMARRMWFYGSDGKFYPVRLSRDEATEGSAEDDKTKKPSDGGAEDDKSKKPSNDDEDALEPDVGAQNKITLRTTDGWYLNIMGGMALYKPQDRIPPEGHGVESIPEYLRPEKAKALFEIPVTFGEKNASRVASTEATVDYQIIATGAHSKGILYYGLSDSNAHIAAPVPGQASERDGEKFKMLDNGWKTWTPEQEIKAGLNQFTLKDLIPNTRYYFRLYVEHDDGRSWDYTSGTFQTAG